MTSSRRNRTTSCELSPPRPLRVRPSQGEGDFEARSRPLSESQATTRQPLNSPNSPQRRRALDASTPDGHRVAEQGLQIAAAGFDR